MQVTNWKEQKDPILKEAAWEREMHYQGMARYERNRVGNNGKAEKFSDSKVGTSATRNLIKELGTDLLDKVVKKAEKEIQSKQEEILSRGGMERRKKAAVLAVPSDALTLMTLKIMLDATFGAADPELGSPYASACRKLGRAVEEEFNFRAWIASSRHKASEYAKENGLQKTPVSIAEKLLKEQGVTKRNLRYWRNIFEDFEEYKWDAEGKELAHFVGEILIRAVTEASPDVFEIINHRTGKHTTSRLTMKEEWRMKLQGKEHQYASAQTVKLPMLTKPKDWQQA